MWAVIREDGKVDCRETLNVVELRHGNLALLKCYDPT